MKKLLSVILTLALVMGLSVPALAASKDFSIESDVLGYYNGKGGDVVIPSGVTKIGDSAFAWHDGVTSVTIPSGVTSIGNFAFADCYSLTSVTIPSSVTSIGAEAFYSCYNLTSVTIPGGVTSIGDGAFTECYSLTSVTIAEGVTTIGGNMFSSCLSLTSITLPKSITTIGESAFSYCESLTSVTIPASVTTIGQRAFYSCRNLTDIYYAGSQAQWAAISIGSNNEKLTNATIHYGNASTTVEPTVELAYARTQTVSIDGKAVELQAYALKDPATGYETNYVKLRDMAHVLGGTAAQFNVGWDGSVNIVTNSPYAANGTEMKTPFSGDRTYTVPTTGTNIDGVAADLAAIVLTDDSGNGYTYYQLRDLGKALGFNVGWSAERGIFVETDKPYSE